MEMLFVYALLYSEGFDVWAIYSDTLDALFVKDPENNDYLALETMAPKDAALHTIAIMGQRAFDPAPFGKCLMGALQKRYHALPLAVFAEKAHSLWNKLPRFIAQEEPFFTLCYAGDCLSFGDEGQCRQLYEKALRYYE